MERQAEILSKLATLQEDQKLYDTNWGQLVDEEDAAQQELDERFGPRRSALEEQEKEFEFLSQVQVIGGSPVWVEEDRMLTTYRSFESPTQPARSVIFNAARGHTTLALGLVKSDSPYRYFRLDSEDLPAGAREAGRWVTQGILPPWREVSGRELNADNAAVEPPGV